MRVGLDSFSLSPLKLEPLKLLDWVKTNGFAGIQFAKLGCDVGRLKEIRKHADSLGLYTHASVSSPNPYKTNPDNPDERIALIIREIESAAECGWHELHACLGGPDDRYHSQTAWSDQIHGSTEMLKKLAPVLTACSSRINLETHGEATTFELVRMVEEVGPETTGICLDTANVLIFGEDPVRATERAAPYTHMTHAKDAILYFTDKGFQRQGKPPGEGLVDWDRVLEILIRHDPELPISIEDHKWLFDIDVFTPEWHAQQPDLSREEFAEVIRLARECEVRIQQGEIPKPDSYEAIPFLEQMDARLCGGRDYLTNIINRLHKGDK